METDLKENDDDDEVQEARAEQVPDDEGDLGEEVPDGEGDLVEQVHDGDGDLVVHSDPVQEDNAPQEQ